MKRSSTRWKTVLVYDPMSNGRAERMTGTGIGKVVESAGKKWDNVVAKVVYGYRRGPLRVGTSAFDPFYGIKPRIIPFGEICSTGAGNRDSRSVELLALFCLRANRIVKQFEDKRKADVSGVNLKLLISCCWCLTGRRSKI